MADEHTKNSKAQAELIKQYLVNVKDAVDEEAKPKPKRSGFFPVAG